MKSSSPRTNKIRTSSKEKNSLQMELLVEDQYMLNVRTKLKTF